ncbi:glycosyltransferase family 2 protein [Butyrivibrio fibrisolvens]
MKNNEFQRDLGSLIMIDISVIVPVYQVELYIEKMMKCLQTQTIQNYKLIIIDDKTEDNSIEIVNAYKDFFGDRMVIIHNSCNMGLSMSRNVGLDYVSKHRTKYVTFLDSDDWVEERYLEDLYSLAEKEQLDLCVAGIIRYEDETNRIICKEMISFGDDVYSIEDCKALAIINPCAYAKIYRFEPICDVRFRSIKRSEDTCYLFECLKKLKLVMFTNNAFYHYRVRSSSLTGAMNDEKYISMHEGFAEIMPLIADNNGTKIKEQFICQVFIRSSVGGVCRLSFKNMKRRKELEKEERGFLDQCITEWRNNTYLNILSSNFGGKKIIALKICSTLYKLHLFSVFICFYYFYNQILGKDVRA